MKFSPIPKLDYVRMLKGIDKLLENDFCMDMNWKINASKFGERNQSFTQKEARKMAGMLGKIYHIAHAIGCPACGRDYWLEKK